jgi:sugar transferase (PEP-CTERM/EpsH1 system associated)
MVTPARRRILFLTPQLPYPPEQGTAIRNYNLIQQVARRHDVALLSFTERPDALPGRLADLCHPLRVVPAPARSMRARLRTLLTTREPDMAHRLRSEAFASELRTLLTHETFDIVQVEGLELAPYALMILDWFAEGAPRIILDDHNAEYVLQRRAFATDARTPRRWPSALYSLVQWRRLERFEGQTCRKVGAVVSVSEADAQALRRWVAIQDLLVVPNGVDVQLYRPGLGDSIPLHHPALVFTGKMDFRPNVDAVLWFHSQVWPRVRQAVPDAHWYVVGKNPHARLAPLRADDAITVTGYVEDILPYFGGADVYIVPLRIGGGTRLKVLEALAAGLPIVSTSLGCEGLGIQTGQHALLADSAEEFAQALITLLGDTARRHALGQAARRFALEHYDWAALAPRLEALYERAPLIRS